MVLRASSTCCSSLSESSVCSVPIQSPSTDRPSERRRRKPSTSSPADSCLAAFRGDVIDGRERPNESRLSCGALKKESSFLRIYARRQLQALVRRCITMHRSVFSSQYRHCEH